MTEPKPATSKHYPEVQAQADFPRLEQEVLAKWQAEGTFQRSIDQRPAGANEFVFYDGPPFANGLPHYGHLLTGFVKDVVPRYQTMRGRRVERRFGWDCHGLPAEMEAEKELGLSGAQAVQSIGLEKYNDACRKSVQRYTAEWRSYVTRQARWVDFDRDYKTMDLSYMESVLWAFQALHQKGLVYEGQRVMAYSWTLQTPVSNFETRIDDATRPRQDPAITIAFSLQPRAGDAGPLRILVWTTTPWTLPSNLALAVGPEIDYAIVQKGDVRYVIGAASIAGYKKELDGFEQVGSMKGKDLVGRTYEPLFPYFAGRTNCFRVLGGDFVDTAEGTGVVHMAPGFGEDDQKVCESNGITLVCPVDDAGCFTAEVPDWRGVQVFDANKDIIKVLKERGVLLRHVTYEHNYPHCWRTREPLIYKAIPGAWFVKVTAIKDRMIQHNQTIRWIPEHVRDGQFGKWLENARDWSISRNRFWGAPIPVWKSDDPKYPRVDVYGSIAELERDFGVKVTDLHRPFVDSLVRKNPDDPTGKSMMRRVPEVLDCWFESGSMPFAQVHYPFENKAWFESHFPADFIVEYVAQTRGWFYTLVVLATALFDKPPFQNVICHGVVLDEKGQKLSKSLRNYPDPLELFQKTGADALRWFLMSSPILRGGDLEIQKDGKQIHEVVRLVLNPIWNAYYFFTLYANTDGVKAKLRSDQTAVLDRYALGKTRAMVEGVQRCMDVFDLAGACQVCVELPRRAQQLVHPPQPRTLLGRDRARRSAGCLRHALHVPRHAVSGRSPAAAAAVREGLHGAHRRAFGAPRRLAGREQAAVRRGAGGADGPGARRVLGRAVAARGQEAAHAPAAAEGRARRCGRFGDAAVRAPVAGRAEREGGRVRQRPDGVRLVPAADRREGARAEARAEDEGRAGGDQVRRVEAGRRARRDRRGGTREGRLRAAAGAEGRHHRGGAVDQRRGAGARHRCHAGARGRRGAQRLRPVGAAGAQGCGPARQRSHRPAVRDRRRNDCHADAACRLHQDAGTRDESDGRQGHGRGGAAGQGW
jgi:isoleucyl-tRNA synthetase